MFHFRMAGSQILIVDDTPASRKLLFKIIEPFGFELREAENGKKALEILESWLPDLIWMDIRMPVMGGLDRLFLSPGLF